MKFMGIVKKKSNVLRCRFTAQCAYNNNILSHHLNKKKNVYKKNPDTTQMGLGSLLSPLMSITVEPYRF